MQIQIHPSSTSTNADFPFCTAKCLRPAGTRAPPAGHSSPSYIANILFQIQNTKKNNKSSCGQQALGHCLQDENMVPPPPWEPFVGNILFSFSLRIIANIYLFLNILFSSSLGTLANILFQISRPPPTLRWMRFASYWLTKSQMFIP